VANVNGSVFNDVKEVGHFAPLLFVLNIFADQNTYEILEM
jgi:hypothetical protein